MVWAWLRAGGQGGEVAIAGAIRRRGGEGLPAQLDGKEKGGCLPPGGSRVMGIHAPSLPETGGLFIRGKLNLLTLL